MLRIFAILMLASLTSSLAQITGTPTASPTSTSSPTVLYTGPGASCIKESNADYECSKASDGVSLRLSDSCLACNEQLDYDGVNGIRKASCDTLRDVVKRELTKCQTECFPSSYECSELEMDATVCILADLFSKTCESNGGSVDTNGVGGGAGNGGGSGSDTSGVTPLFRGSALMAVAIVWIGSVLLL